MYVYKSSSFIVRLSKMVAASTQAAQESNLIPTEIWGSWPRAKTTLASRVLVGVLRKAWLCCWPWFKTIIINNNKRLPFCCSGCFVCVSYSLLSRMIAHYLTLLCDSMYLYSKLSCIFHLQFLCFLVMLALQCTFFSGYACLTIYLLLWLGLLYNLPSALVMLALQFTFFSGYACFTIYLLLWLWLLYNLPSSLVMLSLQFTFFSGYACFTIYLLLWLCLLYNLPSSLV